MNAIVATLQTPEFIKRVKVARNFSGFLRINQNLIREVKNRFRDFESLFPTAVDIRLNFWSGKCHPRLITPIKLENPHSHPQAFLSIDTNGGYVHNIWEISDSSSSEMFNDQQIEVTYDRDTKEKDRNWGKYAKVPQRLALI